MSALRSVGRALAAGGLLLAAGRRRRAEQRRVMPPAPEGDGASRAVLALLLASWLGGGGFIAAFLLGADTQLLGLSLGSVLACWSAAAIIASRTLVPQEERVEDNEPLGEPEAEEEAAEIVREGGQPLSRRKLLVAAAGGSACLTGVAVVLPATSMGPVLDVDPLLETPWQDGRTLVDGEGRPITADTLAVGSFREAFAEGVDHKRLDASLMLVRVEPDELELPPERAGWAADGHLAYSRICTHAGCAVSQFDYPAYRPTSPRPRIVCPCHYSAFDVLRGGGVVAGPAGRPLPQVPLRIGPGRALVAAGPMSTPPGPSWWGVRD